MLFFPDAERIAGMLALRQARGFFDSSPRPDGFPSPPRIGCPHREHKEIALGNTQFRLFANTPIDGHRAGEVHRSCKSSCSAISAVSPVAALRLTWILHKLWGAHAPSRVSVGASPTDSTMAKPTRCCSPELQGCGEAPQAAREARALPRRTVRYSGQAFRPLASGDTA